MLDAWKEGNNATESSVSSILPSVVSGDFLGTNRVWQFERPLPISRPALKCQKKTSFALKNMAKARGRTRPWQYCLATARWPEGAQTGFQPAVRAANELHPHRDHFSAIANPKNALSVRFLFRGDISKLSQLLDIAGEISLVDTHSRMPQKYIVKNPEELAVTEGGIAREAIGIHSRTCVDASTDS